MSRDISNDPSFRAEVCGWIQANNLNPSDIPESSRITIENGRITTSVTVRGSDGRARLAPDGFRLLTETVSVPMIVEPTPDVTEWLRPKCPTCGR